MVNDACENRDFFSDLLRLEKRLEEWLGKSPFRPDAKLLFLTSAQGSITIKEAMHSCALSNRAFYQMLDRLKAERKVVVVLDKIDRRVRRIMLDEAFAKSSQRAAISFTCVEGACRMKSLAALAA